MLAAGVICATLDLNFGWKKVAVVAVPCIWAILMMQGRACLLAAIGALAMRSLVSLRVRLGMSLGAAIAVALFGCGNGRRLDRDR
ncbi:MAG TPA: hypothetical protein VFT56_02475 [Sphingomonas sp.]|nr:hypothetical protein [Sphingomonas sp.]